MMNASQCADILNLWYSKPPTPRNSMHILLDVAIFRPSYMQQHALLLRQLASHADTVEVFDDPIGVAFIALAGGIPKTIEHHGEPMVLAAQISEAMTEAGLPFLLTDRRNPTACDLAVICRWDETTIERVIQAGAKKVVLLQSKRAGNEELGWLAMTFPEMRSRLNSDLDNGLILLERTGQTVIEPTLTEKAATLTRAVAKHAADFWRSTPAVELARRLAACNGCVNLNRETACCKICGCHAATKAAWQSEQCPVGVWSHPRVSCITATYNRVDLLEEAIESFLRQTYDNKELIVINDCPEQELTFDHPNVRIFNLKERFPSLGEKLDWAIRQATGELLCSWDDDDLALPWRISNSVDALEGFEYFNPLAYWVYVTGKFTYEMATGYAHNASIFRKSAWEKVGGYGTACGNQDVILDSKLRDKCSVKEGPTRPKDTGYIYRWGVSNHLSGNQNPQAAWDEPRPKAKRQGRVQLVPRWREDYLALYVDMITPRPDRVRVGVFMPCFATGGVEQWLTGIVNGSSPAVEWVGLCIDDTGPTDQASVDGIRDRVKLLSGPGRADEGRNAATGVRRMKAYEHAAQYVADLSDVLLIWGIQSLPVEYRGARVVVSHGGCDWTKIMLSRLLPVATHYAAVSTVAAGAYPEQLRERVRVILNGVDPSRIVPKYDRREYRERVGLPESATVVGFVGRFSPEKNPYAIAQLIRGTKSAADPWYGLLAGIGWGQAEFIANFKELAGDPTRIKFDFSPENVGDIYNAIDVLVVASDVEGFSLSCVEAWLAGVPVVMVRTGIAAEIGFDDLVTDIPAKATDRELIQAVKKALKDTNKIRRASRIAHEELTAAKMAERWEAFFLEIGKGVPQC